jgi:hypothetical protein
VSIARGRRLLVWEAERQVFGFDHGAVGAALLRSWDLPEVIINAVASHHEPHTSDNPLAMIVYLADAAAHAVGAVGGGGACPRPDWDMAAAEGLGGNADEMWSFLESLECVEEGE